MKNSLFILSLVLIITSCTGSGSSSETSSDDGFGTVISINSSKSDTLNFGSLNQGESMEYNLGVYNNDTIPVVLLEVLTSCGCTTTSFDKKPVMPGDTSLVVLRYDTRLQVKGLQFKKVAIVNTSSSEPKAIYFHVDVK